MKYQSLFSGKIRKLLQLEISSAVVLFFPSMLSVNLANIILQFPQQHNWPASVAQLDARPNGDQEVAGSTPAEVGKFLSWRLIMEYFLRSFSPFR